MSPQFSLGTFQDCEQTSMRQRDYHTPRRSPRIPKINLTPRSDRTPPVMHSGVSPLFPPLDTGVYIDQETPSESRTLLRRAYERHLANGSYDGMEQSSLQNPLSLESFIPLESFAARVPVVVSNTGGLPEVVQHTKTGVVTYTNNSDSLAWGILEVLKNPGYGRWLVDNAYQSLAARFSWDKLAKQTEGIYGRVVKERSQVTW